MIIERKKYLDKIIYALQNVPVTILIGARQVGKTSLLLSLNPDRAVCRLDGQLPEVNDRFADINHVIAFLKIKLNESLNGFLIIDEFQMIHGISSSLKILVDTYKELRVICSGSSSLDIIQKVEESLAGRVRMIYVNSLSFSESVLFTDNALFDEWNLYDQTTDIGVISSQIKSILDNQLIFGGMPRTCLIKDPHEKIRILDDIHKTYLLRDVRAYVRNEDSTGFNKLLKLLALQIGNMVNVNELSQSSGLSYYKCEEYIFLLEQMFIIKLIEPFETNKRNAVKKMKKVFFLDLGIRNILIQNFNPPDSRSDSGALFENFVFLELLKLSENYTTFNFYRSKDGAEVDFIMNDMYKKISIEVKYKSLKNPVFFKALQSFNEEEHIALSYVVNLSLNTSKGNTHYITPFLIEKALGLP